MSTDLVDKTVCVDGAIISEVYEPERVDDATSLLAEASVRGRAALIVGGKTRLRYGNVGGPFDLALSTRRLNRILQYDPDDMTIAVEPGCTIRQLHELLEQHNQAIALDAAREEVATIGGAYATGLSGPRRLAGGSLKDWVIGVEVAGPDGVVAKAGGMVVKNVTGYDMMHVHYGALGALGLVTRLNLKVFPRPASSRSLRLVFVSVEDAYRAGVDLLRSQLQPASITISNPTHEQWLLSVRCDAPTSAIDRLVQRICDAATMHARPHVVESTDTGDDALAPFREAVDLVGNAVVLRFSVPASRQLSVLRDLIGSMGLRICADLGSGLIYAHGDATPTVVEDARRVSQSVTFLALPTELKGGVDVVGEVPSPARSVIHRLKDSFDPTGTINRGRFIFGL